MHNVRMVVLGLLVVRAARGRIDPRKYQPREDMPGVGALVPCARISFVGSRLRQTTTTYIQFEEPKLIAFNANMSLINLLQHDKKELVVLSMERYYYKLTIHGWNHFYVHFTIGLLVFNDNLNCDLEIIMASKIQGLDFL